MSFKSSVVGNMSILGVWKPKIPSNPSCISLQLRIWKSSPRGSLLPKVSDSRTCASEFTPIPCVLHGPVCADETINSTKRKSTENLPVPLVTQAVHVLSKENQPKIFPVFVLFVYLITCEHCAVSINLWICPYLCYKYLCIRVSINTVSFCILQVSLLAFYNFLSHLNYVFYLYNIGLWAVLLVGIWVACVNVVAC
jgi:hypothetical protein